MLTTILAEQNWAEFAVNGNRWADASAKRKKNRHKIDKKLYVNEIKRSAYRPKSERSKYSARVFIFALFPYFIRINFCVVLYILIFLFVRCCLLLFNIKLCEELHVWKLFTTDSGGILPKKEWTVTSSWVYENDCVYCANGGASERP